MANTYTQIIIQIIFVVQGRESIIKEKYRDELEKYISGIVIKNKSKLLAIYCNPDHTHVLIGLSPDISVSTISREIKSNSSKWINENKWFKGKFRWQIGFSAFSYSKSQVDIIVKYILNQPEHHKKVLFKDEYLDLLKKTETDYNEKYLFE